MNRDEIQIRFIASALSWLASAESGAGLAPVLAKTAKLFADEALKLLDAELAPTAAEPTLNGQFLISNTLAYGWTVAWDNQTVTHLNWDEMIAQLIVLTVPENKVRARRHYTSTFVNQTPQNP
jgi:hypothetical protein